MTEALTDEKQNGNLSLYKKLAEVQKAVGTVEKKGHNDAQGYDYARAEDVITEVREQLNAKGVLILPAINRTSSRATERVDKKTGEVRPGMPITTAHMTYRIVDAETGESITCPWEGEGADAADKSLPKAYTASLKYFLRDLFLIPFGDDPEADERTDRASQGTSERFPPSEKQTKYIRTLAEDLGVDADDSLLIEHYAQHQLTGGKTGSASQTIEALKNGTDKRNAGEVLAGLLKEAKEYAASQSDIPPPDPSQFETPPQEDGLDVPFGEVEA
jgi:hypothetical protein